MRDEGIQYCWKGFLRLKFPLIIVGDDQDVVYDWNVFAKKCYDFCNDPRSCKPYLVAAVQFIEWFTVE